MPVSKKPRRKKTAKASHPYSFRNFVSAESIDQTRDVMVSVQLKIEQLLPRGEMKAADLQELRDLINFSSVLFHCGNYVDKQKVEEMWPIWQKATAAYVALRDRFNATGRSTCWAHEQQAILDGLAIGGDVIDLEFEKEPGWAFKCYLWNRYVSYANVERTFKVDIKTMKKKIQDFDAISYGRKLTRLGLINVPRGGENGRQQEAA